jgi:hypothetical protein
MEQFFFNKKKKEKIIYQNSFRIIIFYLGKILFLFSNFPLINVPYFLSLFDRQV